MQLRRQYILVDSVYSKKLVDNFRKLTLDFKKSPTVEIKTIHK